MNPGNPKERLEELIASSGVSLTSLTPQAGLELMLRLYGDDPANGVLTGRWGVVTRYGEEEVGFDFTCRFFSPPDDTLAPTPPGLCLLFKIGPLATAGDFPGWTIWCTRLAHLTAFRATIERSPPFEAWGRSAAAGVALVCEDASWTHELFDCWGARDPSRPVVSMTEEEWLRSDDVPLMLRWFRQEWRGEEADLDRLLQRYLLACCRRIWRLLPQEESRTGVEVAERFADGRATREEFARADWLAEGAAFKIERAAEPESLARWCGEVSRIPPEELAAMLQSPRPEDDLSPRGLLEHAAYFADSAMCYPGSRPKEAIERYRLFLPATLLRLDFGHQAAAKNA